MNAPQKNSSRLRTQAMFMPLLLVGALGFAADMQLHPQLPRAGSARLNVHVLVVPILETSKPRQPVASGDSVSFNLQPEAAAPQRLYETRPLKTSGVPVKDPKGAVLETLTIVPQ
jgi:hypothetical protein